MSNNLLCIIEVVGKAGNSVLLGICGTGSQRRMNRFPTGNSGMLSLLLQVGIDLAHKRRQAVYCSCICDQQGT